MAIEGREIDGMEAGRSGDGRLHGLTLVLGALALLILPGLLALLVGELRGHEMPGLPDLGEASAPAVAPAPTPVAPAERLVPGTGLDLAGGRMTPLSLQGDGILSGRMPCVSDSVSVTAAGSQGGGDPSGSIVYSSGLAACATR